MDDVAALLAAKARWVIACVWRRRWLGLGAALVIALAGGVAVSLHPNRYEASARVFVDTETVLKPLMTGLTFQPDIDQQVRMLARTLISRPNVERLLKNPELELDVSDSAAREKVVSSLMDQIKVVPAGTGNLYQISYRGSDPQRAQRMVEATVSLFVRSGVGAKKRDSQDAGRFIEDQIRSYEAKLIEAENRLKDFKLRNFGLSGVSDQDHFSRISKLSDEVKRLRIALAAAEHSRDAYRRELSAEPPQLPGESSPKARGPELTEIEARLELQRKQLDELLRRYTEAHPDVTSARRIIVQLEEERRLRAEAARSAASGYGAGQAATSPVYQKIRIALAESEAQVASLRSQLAAEQASLDQTRTLASRVPQVEAEYAQLNRDYDIMRKQYEVMVTRRESASLGVKLDESSQLAEFRLIEPPRVSFSPVFPSRLHLALIACLATFAGGVLASLAADHVRPTVLDARSLEAWSGRRVIGSVSMVISPGVLSERRSSAIRFSVAVGVLLLAQAGWLAWIASRSLTH